MNKLAYPQYHLNIIYISFVISLFRGPKFELVARGSLTLSDVDTSVRTFDLQMEVNSGEFKQVISCYLSFSLKGVITKKKSLLLLYLMITMFLLFQ